MPTNAPRDVSARALGRRAAVAALLAAALTGAATVAAAGEGASMGRDQPDAAPPARGAADHTAVRLPDDVGGFRRTGPLRTILPAAIFEYMDGAGELYLAYRFDRLEVAEYVSPEGGDVLVELYWMGGPDDAYGLLSQDWGGEPVALSPSQAPTPPRALYGAGLLRLWSGELFARVLASRQSEASRSSVLALGCAIVAGRRDAPPPRLAAALPARAAGAELRRETVCFLRSHLVLNSAYFLAQRDILDLGPGVEAVTARYGKARLLLVRYPDAASARAALERFRSAYLPEARAGGAGCARVEDGWAAWRLSGRGLALGFEAPEREGATALVDDGARALAESEGSHG